MSRLVLRANVTRPAGTRVEKGQGERSTIRLLLHKLCTKATRSLNIHCSRQRAPNLRNLGPLYLSPSRLRRYRRRRSSLVARPLRRHRRFLPIVVAASLVFTAVIIFLFTHPYHQRARRTRSGTLAPEPVSLPSSPLYGRSPTVGSSPITSKRLLHLHVPHTCRRLDIVSGNAKQYSTLTGRGVKDSVTSVIYDNHNPLLPKPG